LPPQTIANRMGCSRKAVIRWLGEIGVTVRATRPLADVRERGWTTMAKLSTSRRRAASKLYLAWDSMKKRCYGTRQRYREAYAARGIGVCDEWRENYAEFRRWALANGFDKGLSLDRIDNDSGYRPDNCRWIPTGQQQENTRRTILMTLHEVTKPLSVWSRELNISKELLRSRLQEGWTDAQALTIPVGRDDHRSFTSAPGANRGSTHEHPSQSLASHPDRRALIEAA
jgi:hypothetical protein